MVWFNHQSDICSTHFRLTKRLICSYTLRWLQSTRNAPQKNIFQITGWVKYEWTHQFFIEFLLDCSWVFHGFSMVFHRISRDSHGFPWVSPWFFNHTQIQRNQHRSLQATHGQRTSSHRLLEMLDVAYICHKPPPTHGKIYIRFWPPKNQGYLPDLVYICLEPKWGPLVLIGISVMFLGEMTFKNRGFFGTLGVDRLFCSCWVRLFRCFFFCGRMYLFKIVFNSIFVGKQYSIFILNRHIWNHSICVYLLLEWYSPKCPLAQHRWNWSTNLWPQLSQCPRRWIETESWELYYSNTFQIYASLQMSEPRQFNPTIFSTPKTNILKVRRGWKPFLHVHDVFTGTKLGRRQGNMKLVPTS